MQFWSKPTNRFAGWSQSAFSDTLFWLFLAGWIGPVILTLAYTFWNFNNLPAEIPLFYSRIWGEGQLAKNIYIFLPVGGVFLLGIFNFGLAVNFHFRDRVISYLLGGAAALVSVLALITTLNIVNLIAT